MSNSLEKRARMRPTSQGPMPNARSVRLPPATGQSKQPPEIGWLFAFGGGGSRPFSIGHPALRFRAGAGALARFLARSTFARPQMIGRAWSACPFDSPATNKASQPLAGLRGLDGGGGSRPSVVAIIATPSGPPPRLAPTSCRRVEWECSLPRIPIRPARRFDSPRLLIKQTAAPKGAAVCFGGGGSRTQFLLCQNLPVVL